MSESVKEIVKETINELLGKSIIKYSDLVIYDTMGEQLREHYIKHDPLIADALDKLKDHEYIDILEMYYHENMTLETIAYEYDVDISTIVRNKKALCIKIFEIINGA